MHLKLPVKPRIAILGKIPPPFGGVTVHLNRLIYKLADMQVPYTFFDAGGRRVIERNIVPAKRSLFGLIKFLFTVKEHIVQFNTNRVLAIMMALLILPLRRKGVVINLHSEAPMRWYYKTNPLCRFIFRYFIRRSCHLMCASPPIGRWFSQMGVSDNNITVAPAFIIPPKAETSENNLSDEIKDFFRNHTPVIGTHGWFGNFINGIHVYSFDMIIELIQLVRREHPRAGFYTFISGDYDHAHRKEIFETRRKLGLEKDWLILEGISSAVALYVKSDIFVRPTITDGDSVSIKECLSVGTPVIASDAVQRAPGCVLFKNRDMKSLHQTVEKVLQDLPGFRERVRSIGVEDCSDIIIELYKRLLDNVNNDSNRKEKR
jgi:glycosyltransferase involved in cell wall biosynthesis